MLFHERYDGKFHFKCQHIRPKLQRYYYEGNIELLHENLLGIVWPRRMSPLWKKTIEDLFDLIPKYKISIISWLAYGVDQHAHQLSIQKGTPTIAVLGGGINRFKKQKENALISQIISHNGLILSEYEPDFAPTLYSFPQRNRIIAGLSDILFIPEAGLKSGSLITANFAYKMKKPIYGTPNHIYAPQHQWLLQMISEKKIQLCIDLDQMLKTHFSTHTTESPKIHFPDLSPEEQEILHFIQAHPNTNIQSLMLQSNRKSQEVICLTNILELKGLIHQNSPGFFTTKK